jgi:hypothetical protein
MLRLMDARWWDVESCIHNWGNCHFFEFQRELRLFQSPKWVQNRLRSSNCLTIFCPSKVSSIWVPSASNNAESIRTELREMKRLKFPN